VKRSRPINATVRRWRVEVRRTLALALPIMSGLVGQMLMGLADTIMVGRVGTVPLAAAAFANNLCHIPMVAALGLLAAVSVRTAHAYGAARPAQAGEVLRHGVYLAVIAGVSAAALLGYGRAHVGWLRQPPEVVAAAQVYLLYLAGSLLPALVAQALKHFSEALNRPWPPTVILLGGVLLNVFLNWLLIFGHWGFPRLGLEGAGLATLVARLVTMAVMFAFVVRSPGFSACLPRRWLARVSVGELREQWRLGAPVAAQHLLEVGAFATAALMMGWIHAEAMAAHQIAITCAATTFICALGIGMAVSIRIGHAWGARAHRRLRRIGYSGLVATGCLMAGFALLFILAGRPIAAVFSSAPEVIALAAGMLFVAGFFQIFDGLQVVALSALRGMADVRVPAVIAAVAYWLIALPLGYSLAFPLGLGATGIWIGLAGGLATAAIVLIHRFRAEAAHQGGSRKGPYTGPDGSVSRP
jgi:MATE family multidrug resistance protein